MKVKVTWDDILARRAAQDGGADGLTALAEVILEASNQLVPYDTGTLMGTGQVDFDLEELKASVYYDTVYAAKLHQNPKWHFQNGRRGKYLRTAVMQARPRAAQFIGDKMKLRFRGRRKPASA